MDNVFDMTKGFDDYARNVRTALMWVYPTELRDILVKTVDLQVETSKLVNKTAADMINKLIPVNSK